VVLKGNCRHFQAGADLKWINAVRPQSPDENEAVSQATFEAVQRLNTLPIPTVALVQGGCFGGGTGVISACDVVIAADNAVFSITEVRWGLTAAIIIPQLCDSIGVRQVRRYALTGERFGADEARRIGLVHEVVPLADLEEAGARTVAQLLANGPEALAETKALAMESSFGGMSLDGSISMAMPPGSVRMPAAFVPITSRKASWRRRNRELGMLVKSRSSLEIPSMKDGASESVDVASLLASNLPWRAHVSRSPTW